MQDRQQGMTFLGILVLVIVVGAWVYAGIRLVPKYLEYVRVAATLSSTSRRRNMMPSERDR